MRPEMHNLAVAEVLRAFRIESGLALFFLFGWR